jgi:SAM-dependent methyltransferase
MAGPDREFWQARFQQGHTPWDRGACNPQLLSWFDQGLLQGLGVGARVAVPGCGSGHEVLEWARRGYEVYAIDYAPAALESAKGRLAHWQAQHPAQAEQAGRIHWICADVRLWRPPEPLDAIYEQTCLCALHPDHWVSYAAALHQSLGPGGLLLALLMQSPKASAESGHIEGPPYHVDVHAARALLPEPLWRWPAPPYARVPHPMGMSELAVVLQKRPLCAV